MTIIRLCRTFPRQKSPGVGLHCFHFTQNIKIKTIIFTKFENDKKLDIPSHAKLFEVRYADLSFSKIEENLVRTVAIYFSKAMAEFVFFITVMANLLTNRTTVTLIHLHSINHIISAVLIKLLYNKPLVINFGGTDLLRVKNKAWLRFLVSKADKVIFVSNSMEPDLALILGKEKIRYIGNGVDLDFFQRNREPNYFQIVAIGNLRWQKGYKYLIDAIKKTAENFENVRLFIIGEGRDRLEIEAQIRKNNIEDKVVLCGACSREDVRNILNESYLFVCSSVSEGLPKALLEAIATETPVVVTDVGDCKDVAAGVGITVNPASSAELANAIQKILSNSKLHTRFKISCREKRNIHSWKNMVREVSKAYSELGVV